MVFGCAVIVNTFQCGSALLNETVELMESTKDQQEMTPKGALVCHPEDHLPP